MRIECEFVTKVIPVNYNFLMMSLIKESISLYDESKIKDLYEFDNKNNKKIKPFTFAVFLNGFRKDKDEFHISGSVKLIVSSVDSDLLLKIYNGITQKKNFCYEKKYELSCQKVRLLPEILPKDSKALFRTLSPLVVKNRNNQFISLDDPDFSEAFHYISDQVCLEIRGYGLRSFINFTPISMKKRVVQLKHAHFENLNKESTLYINSHVGNFVLEGDVEDLKLLTQVGIGYRRSQGFGCIEYIR